MLLDHFFFWQNGLDLLQKTKHVLKKKVFYEQFFSFFDKKLGQKTFTLNSNNFTNVK